MGSTVPSTVFRRGSCQRLPAEDDQTRVRARQAGPDAAMVHAMDSIVEDSPKRSVNNQSGTEWMDFQQGAPGLCWRHCIQAALGDRFDCIILTNRACWTASNKYLAPAYLLFPRHRRARPRRIQWRENASGPRAKGRFCDSWAR